MQLAHAERLGDAGVCAGIRRGDKIPGVVLSGQRHYG
jgi:hypothetical protein